MFGVSAGELVVIVLVALVVLGPQKLPEVAKQLGKAMRELRRASADLQQAFNDAAELDDKAPPPKAPPATTPLPSPKPNPPPKP